MNLDDLKLLAGLSKSADTPVQEQPQDSHDGMRTLIALVTPEQLNQLQGEADLEEEGYQNSGDHYSGEPEEYKGPLGSPADLSLRRYLGANGEHVTVDETKVYEDHKVEDITEAFAQYKAAQNQVVTEAHACGCDDSCACGGNCGPDCNCHSGCSATNESDDKPIGADPLLQGFGKGVSDDVNDVAATMEEDSELAKFAYDFEKIAYTADEQNADTIRKALELVLPSALHSRIEELMKVIESAEVAEGAFKDMWTKMEELEPDVMRLKAEYMDKGMEPEEAQDAACEKLGCDPMDFDEYLTIKFDELEEADVEENAFNQAAAAAARAGKDTFEFGGKTHKTTMKKDVAHKLDDDIDMLRKLAGL